MSTSWLTFRTSLSALATAALIGQTPLVGAATPVDRPLMVAPLKAAVNLSAPAVTSVGEASARALTLKPSAPLSDAEIGAAPPVMANLACYPVNPTFRPQGLLPTAGFTSSPTTPYPQATWPANTNANETINYVIQRAVLNTSVWTTVASTCGGSPSLFRGYSTFDHTLRMTFIDSSGGIQPGTTYVYKIIAVDQNNFTDWSSFQWTSQPVLPTIQVSRYQHNGNTITFTAAQFYNLAGQVVDPARQLLVTPSNGPAFLVGPGTNGCSPGSYGLVCLVTLNAAQVGPAGVTLAFQWGAYYGTGFHVLVQSGITMATP